MLSASRDSSTSSTNFSVEQVELMRRLRNSGISREGLLEIYDQFEKIDNVPDFKDTKSNEEHKQQINDDDEENRKLRVDESSSDNNSDLGKLNKQQMFGGLRSNQRSLASLTAEDLAEMTSAERIDVCKELEDDDPALHVLIRKSEPTISEEIRDFVALNGIKQHQVAVLAGVSQSYISKYLRTDYGDISEKSRRSIYKWYLTYKDLPAQAVVDANYIGAGTFAGYKNRLQTSYNNNNNTTLQPPPPLSLANFVSHSLTQSPFNPSSILQQQAPSQAPHIMAPSSFPSEEYPQISPSSTNATAPPVNPSMSLIAQALLNLKNENNAESAFGVILKHIQAQQVHAASNHPNPQHAYHHHQHTTQQNNVDFVSPPTTSLPNTTTPMSVHMSHSPFSETRFNTTNTNNSLLTQDWNGLGQQHSWLKSPSLPQNAGTNHASVNGISSRRDRFTFHSEQVALLEKWFEQESYPSVERREEMAVELSTLGAAVSIYTINNWFANKRKEVKKAAIEEGLDVEQLGMQRGRGRPSILHRIATAQIREAVKRKSSDVNDLDDFGAHADESIDDSDERRSDSRVSDFGSNDQDGPQDLSSSAAKKARLITDTSATMA